MPFGKVARPANPSPSAQSHSPPWIHLASRQPFHRRKQDIEEHYAEDFTLGGVALMAHSSTFCFFALFRKTTGLKFTDYATRERIGKPGKLLLNPNLGTSEIVSDMGLQSLTHFNRVFKLIRGQSPADDRSQWPAA